MTGKEYEIFTKVTIPEDQEAAFRYKGKRYFIHNQGTWNIEIVIEQPQMAEFLETIGGYKMGGRGSSFRGSKVGGSFVPKESYEKFPYGYNSKYATKEEKKQVSQTISKFMENAQIGDVYSTGNGFGSLGSTFTITERGNGKKMIKAGHGNPVQMSRENVRKYIANGATLVSREKKKKTSYKELQELLFNIK